MIEIDTIEMKLIMFFFFFISVIDDMTTNETLNS